MILDTTIVLAGLRRRDPRHAEARAVIEGATANHYIHALVVAECAYFAGRDSPEIELAFLANLIEGSFIPIQVLESDWKRIADLVWKYRDLPLGTTDAATVAVAERMEITRIATFDQDFAVVQPAHAERFELLP